jgi:6-phosphogluconolactonase (cycloisomerase 2 family)
MSPRRASPKPALLRFSLFGSLVAGASFVALSAAPARGQDLPLLQAHVAGFGQLDGPIAVEVSPDGRHVYVASFLGDSVQLFRREPRGGALTWVSTYFNGDDAAPGGLDGAVALALSPDGLHLYVAGLEDDALVVFERDAVAGFLSYSTEITEPSALLGGASGVAVSADGGRVWVTALESDALLVFSRDPASGLSSLLAATTSPILDDARAVDVDAQGRALVVAKGADTLSVWEVSPGPSPALTAVETLTDGVAGADGLDGAYDLSLSADGMDVYVAAFDEDSLAHFRRAPGGGDLELVAVHAHPDFLGAAAGVWASADGRNVYVTGNQSHAVAATPRDALTGELGPSFWILPASNPGIVGLSGATGIAGSPDGEHVYVAALGARAVSAFRRTSSTGSLEFVAAQRDRVPFADGSGDDALASRLQETVAVVASSDGRHVYTAREGAEAAIVLFQRDRARGGSGALTARQIVPAGKPVTPTLALSPEGAHLYVGVDAESGADSLAIFSRQQQYGGLTFVDEPVDGVAGFDGLGGVAGLAFTPDGEHLFVAARDDDALVHLARSPTSGLLTPVRTWTASGDGLPLGGAAAVGVSPDGRYVYVAAGGDAALVTFELLPGGTLAHRDSLAGVQLAGVLQGATALEASRDGRNLYVAAATFGSVVAFELGANGLPTFLHALSDGVDGVEGLAGASGLVSSRFGDVIWVCGPADDSLVTLVRNADGTLDYRGASDGIGGSFRLTEPVQAALAPDGRHLYVASRGVPTLLNDGGVAQLEAMLFGDGFESGNFFGWSAVVPPIGPPP